jgi:signal-transduction protein with cAMP-binding, CBS, and nucleotidyltransferase domain
MKEHEEALYNYINSINPVSRDWFEELYKQVVFRNYIKGELFIEQGKPDQYEYFLIEGVCRSFLKNTENEDVTISFFTAVAFLSPSSIRTANGISQFSYQALTDVTMGCIEVRSFLNLMMHISEIRAFRNAMLHHELIEKVEKEVNLVQHNPKERVQYFRKNFPALEGLTAHSYIASYLGIAESDLNQ